MAKYNQTNEIENTLSFVEMNTRKYGYINITSSPTTKRVGLPDHHSLPIKRTRFSQDNHTVITIPSRMELLSSTESSFSDLWYEPKEIYTFQNEAYNEMREHLYENNCDIKQGLMSLNQLQDRYNMNVMDIEHENDDVDENKFVANNIQNINASEINISLTCHVWNDINGKNNNNQNQNINSHKTTSFHQNYDNTDCIENNSATILTPIPVHARQGNSFIFNHELFVCECDSPSV